MKKNLPLIILLISIGLSSCKKSGTNSGISNDDAANIIAHLVSSYSQGSTQLAEGAADRTRALLLNTSGLICGSTIPDPITNYSTTVSTQFSGVTFRYDINYNNKLNCNTNNQPDNFSNTTTYSGTLSDPFLSIANSGTSSYVIAGLTSASTVYTLTGSHNGTGTFKLKSDTTDVGNVNINITISSMVILKSAPFNNTSITSGAATFTLNGSTPKKGSFNINGSLTYNGTKNVTLNLNGAVYLIDLGTIAVTKQ